MPEIAEVYRAARILRKAALGKRVVKVDTIEDDLVFVGGAANFRKNVEGTKVETVERYGKHFYMTLSNAISVVFHLGMSGYVHIKGEPPVAYRRKPKDPTLWPPKYWRFVLTLDDEQQFAFMDSRRFGRIKVLNTSTPKLEAPLKDLGFDAICNMATLEQFTAIAKKRKCPIKALLLNQKFLAGVGNWVADEILYQSKVHPAQVANTLTDEQIQRLFDNTIEVCNFAVSVDADHSKFPAHWLFKYRWGKSHASRKRKAEKVGESVSDGGEGSDDHGEDGQDTKDSLQPLGKTMIRADGKKLNIQWITCGGRTSAFVVDEQILPLIDNIQVETTEEVKEAVIKKVARSKRLVTSQVVKEEEQEENEETVVPIKKSRKRKSMVTSESGESKIPSESAAVATPAEIEAPISGRRTSARLHKKM